MPLFPTQWKQGELVTPIKPRESSVGDAVFLGDFGLAIKAGTPVIHKIESPVKYCAPERLHDKNPNFATDMWSYMCIFVELYIGAGLFFGYGNPSTVTYMVNTLGPFPASWKGAYKGGPSDDSWYDQERELEATMAPEEKILRLRPDISLAEQQLVFSVFRRGFSYVPENRLTAAQLLEDRSFMEVMAIYGL
ncbi:hypothetical protein QQX98_004901 [Neonectria punicea]|uniref:Protein kinase domain-containing protein n=1 Tax=Neonectria punicea TaxID=979145 RepID=A0ABR1H6V0_9HYPO